MEERIGSAKNGEGFNYVVRDDGDTLTLYILDYSINRKPGKVRYFANFYINKGKLRIEPTVERQTFASMIPILTASKKRVLSFIAGWTRALANAGLKDEFNEILYLNTTSRTHDSKEEE